GHARLMRRWWRNYTGAATKWARENSYPGQVENYLTSMLSRRLGFAAPVINRGWSTTEDLDSVLGTLLGAESVRIAMQKDRLLATGANAEAAIEPVPKPVETRPIEYPEVRGDVKIEPIAMHVPEECQYIRFGSFANFQWIRDAMTAAGTDTRNIISMRGLAYNTNKRMERQLATRETAVSKLLGGTVISDVAIIGTDTFMREGAATALLFEARNSALLASQFKSQRDAIKKGDPSIREETLKIAGRDVSFMSTPDNRVRSFYAVDGSYHLISTSRYIVERFFEAGAGKRALGGSNEFRYARSVMPISRGDTVFVYMSDAFFRNLVSPQYRVEMTRRMQAVADIELIHMARWAAKAEGKKHETVTDLVEGGLLPTTFAKRPDGSVALILDDGEVIDSMRGARGTFTPVPDVPIERVTRSEANAYKEFGWFYRSQWEQMDPVVIGIKRAAASKPDREAVTVDIRVTPFARRRYDFLARYLAPANKESVSPLEDDLASIDISVGPAGLPLATHWADRHVFAGLRDFKMDYTISGGRVRPRFLTTNIAGYMGTWPAADPAAVWRADLIEPLDAAGYRPLPPILLVGGLWERQFDKFSVISFKKPVLEEVTPKIEVFESKRDAQVRLHIGELVLSRLAGLLNAKGYEHARKLSVANTRFLHSLSNQLQVPREKCLEEAEKLLDAQLVCTLGGDYKTDATLGDDPIWVSDAWTGPNRFQITTIPRDYIFPAMDWFRDVKIDFALHRDVLAAHVQLEMKKAPAKAGGGFAFPALPKAKPAEELPPPKRKPAKPMPE
ncbi:MAG: hypothetical protein MI757_04025, partial [Pirellulales bacterium]|nr:hypothetical protein [Pirellulales bacterium]